MKKKLLPILLLSLYSGAAMAQVTLTASTTSPVPGESLLGYLNIGNTPSPGAAGANITWDYSAVTSTTIDSIEYVACSANPDCGNFPNSTVVGNDPIQNTTLFLNTNNNAETVVGEKVGAQSIFFTDGEDELRFPLTYNGTYTDPFAATLTTNSIQFLRSGNITVTYDGYGTLILPYATINNAVRVHRAEIYQDSANVAGMPMILSYQTDAYSWYSTEYRGELMNIVTITIMGQTQSYTYYTKQTPTSVSNINDAIDVTVFPNPANGVVNIRYGNTNGNSVHISIADVTGREVAVLAGTNNGQVQYNTSNLQAGVYFVRLQTDNGTVTKKLEVL